VKYSYNYLFNKGLFCSIYQIKCLKKVIKLLHLPSLHFTLPSFLHGKRNKFDIIEKGWRLGKGTEEVISGIF